MIMSRIRTRRLGVVSASAVIVLMICLLIHDFYLITPEPLGGDATQNVRSSVNLAKYDVYSRHAISPEVVPGYRREPLPNFLLALYLRVADLYSPGFLDQVGQPFSDGFLVFIKQINLVWAAALFIGLWLTSQLVFMPLLASHWLAFIQILAVNRFFVVMEIDIMNTELIAGAVLVWLGVILLKASRSQSWRWLLVSGSVIGLMALTKSSVAYVSLAVLPLVALLLAGGFSKRFWRLLLAIFLGFVITVTPWLARNQLHFSKPVIAQGGGDVLLIRSIFNQMNHQQYRDSFYAFAPQAIRHKFLGPLMSLSDSDFECERRLDVFNRRLECDRKALDQERFGEVRSFYQRGKRAIPYLLSLDRAQKKALALQEFRNNPWGIFATSVPFAWRGFWGFPARKWIDLVINAAAFFALLLAPLLAWLERRLSWLLVSVMPVALFLFYSLVSHFLPRYSSPLVPSALVCLSMLIVDCSQRLSRRFRSAELPPIKLS